MFRQPVLVKENSESKSVKLRWKIELGLHPARAEELGKYIYI